jgi:CRISPR-associated protein Csd1
MSWLEQLYKTYNACAGKEGSEDLIPLGHSTCKAHIEIAIDGKGSFRRARILEGEEAFTTFPCTEQSAGRTSGTGAAHPLCDQLRYVASDYYNAMTNSPEFPRLKERFASYHKILSSWCASPHRHNKVSAVLEYVSRGTLMDDLAQARVLAKDPKTSQILTEWKEKDLSEAPRLYQSFKKEGVGKAFVRWVVEIPGDPKASLWNDPTVWNSWSSFYLETLNCQRGLAMFSVRLDLWLKSTLEIFGIQVIKRRLFLQMIFKDLLFEVDSPMTKKVREVKPVGLVTKHLSMRIMHCVG